jgi:hypothetical protein
MATLSDPRSTLRRWSLRFVVVEVALLIALLLLAWLSLAQWEARVFLVNLYMVIGFALLMAWVFVLIGQRSRLTSLRAALRPCWLPFAFVLIWMIFTLFSD